MRRHENKEILPGDYYINSLKTTTDKTLLDNVFKIFDWISENCPTYTGNISLAHDTYRYRALSIENGYTVYEVGSHGGGFSLALSNDFTEEYTQGSCQSVPYRYNNEFFFRNKDLEYLLCDWPRLKNALITKNNEYKSIHSNSFKA